MFPAIRRFLPVLLLVLLSLQEGSAHATVPPAPMVDFRERVIPASHYLEKVMVYFVCGRQSKVQMEPLTRVFGARVGENPSVDYLTVIDLRTLPRLFSPFVKGILGKAHRETVARIASQRASLGHPPDPSLGDHFYLVTDWDGSLQKALGTQHDDKNVVMAVVGKEGEPKGVFVGPAGLEEMLLKVESLLSR